jgi:predicted component of type VI protein secretion system
MSNAFLVDPGQPEQRWPLPAADGAQLILGREAPADIVFARAPVSRRHAVITVRDGMHWLADLGSRNGTFLRGAAVGTEPQRLIDGDEVVLGGAVALRFIDPTHTQKGQRIGRLHGIWVDAGSGDVYVDGARIDPPLSAAQTTLLSTLFANEGQVISRDAIVAAVWPSDTPEGISEEAIDGLIKRLRARLREVAPNVDHIELVRGRGVRLRKPG